MRILLLALCLVAAALYAKILEPELDFGGYLPVTSEIWPGNATQPTAEDVTLRDVPDSQIAVMREVFAPELSQ